MKWTRFCWWSLFLVVYLIAPCAAKHLVLLSPDSCIKKHCSIRSIIFCADHSHAHTHHSSSYPFFIPSLAPLNSPIAHLYAQPASLE
ncbi:hypothetical protein K457DRAFT_326778 [Linnemannia elongata AG-77]|uniref:Secreted protein n=1 Tax=Linnemannia elongata AG-77 TaxID=1314771 RepID=A0A197K706_9FUNG|nr:hypothetical protein K457DRAFT_326778 [Linnemannia elongata AG-77]